MFGGRPDAAFALGTTRTTVDRWLTARGLAGYRAGEVMAFTRNDYVEVLDLRGRAAFALLTGRGNGRVVQEPGPDMMWNTRYGMMRTALGAGSSWWRRWCAAARPGEGAPPVGRG